ncbi:MAG: hypothetical protein GXY87_02220 [Tissierellia bacterium]|nr:hypothetical protein [Tissierellia bacterium]
MKLDKEFLKNFENQVVKVSLINGNYIRGNYRGYEEKDGVISVIVESVTYKFQVDDKDITGIEKVSVSIW